MNQKTCLQWKVLQLTHAVLPFTVRIFVNPTYHEVMPELPEVETMRRGILGIVGATIQSVERTPCQKRPISIQPSLSRMNRRIADRKITAVDRLGKRVVLVLETGDRLVFEPRMTGLVLIDQPPTTEHLRFRLSLSDGNVTEVLFWDRRGLGNIRLYSEKQYQAKQVDGSLGPDALAISAIELAERFSTRNRAVKVALLDQSLVAGVGNLYASELLHLAGIHPEARCNRITKTQWENIHACMVEILEIAIQYEGSTLSDGTYRNALNQSGGYQNEHRVYDRAGEPCQFCGAKIQRIVQAQRATFFCGKCQKKRGVRKRLP